MAQDPPRTFDQGHPHGDTTGQQPGGYDHQQQAWYPQQPDQQPADPWGTAGQQAYPAGADQQQAWQPQADAGWAQGHSAAGYADYYAGGQTPAQPAADPYAPGGAYGGPAADPYASGGYESGNAYAPTGAYPTGEAYAPTGAYAPTDGYAPTDPYATTDGYAATDPYAGYGTGGTEQQAYQPDQSYQAHQPDQLYAPSGTDSGYTAYEPYQPAADGHPDTSATGFPPSAAVPPTVETGAAVSGGGTGADGPDGGSGRPRSLVERAKAAAAAAVTADHSPGRRTLLIRAGAGVAALAVLVTAGVLATSGGGSDKGGSAAGSDSAAARNFNVAHAKAWAVTPAAAGASAAPATTDDTLTGGWVTADAAVRADGSGVRAYALADGKPTWSVAAPADGAVPCGLSPTVGATGLGVALFRTGADPKSPCTLLAAVDTKTGKTAWTKTLSDTKDAYAAHVAVLGDKVIAVGDDKVSAWAAADGKDLWQYGGPGKFCSLSGGASGATVLLHSNCADSTPADQAVALNAADGKLKWWRGLNNQPKTVTVLSAEPAVVATTGANATDDRVFAWGATGDPAAEIPVTGQAGRLDVSRGTFDAAPTVYFHGTSLIATLGPAEGGIPTAVTAYDLTTGKPQWTTVITEKRKARAVGLEADTGLLLAVDERLDQPAHISRFALTGGQETQGGAFPKGTGSLLSAGLVLNGTGKVVVLPEHAANFGSATAFQAKG